MGASADKQRGLTAAWASIIVAVIGLGGAVLVWALGAIANKDNKGQSVTVINNMNTGLQVLGHLITGGTMPQVPAPAPTATESGRQPPWSQPMTLKCDDAQARTARAVLANLQGTKNLSYAVDSHPCSRELKLSVSGGAISLEPAGARTAEFVITDGSKELCKASATLPQGFKENVEFQTNGWSECKVVLPANQTIKLIAETKGLNRADPLRIALVVHAEPK